MSENTGSIAVQVVVTNSAFEHMSEVWKRLEEAGMEVLHAYNEMGIISGRVDASKVPAIRNVQGVLRCEEQRPAH